MRSQKFLNSPAANGYGRYNQQPQAPITDRPNKRLPSQAKRDGAHAGPSEQQNMQKQRRVQLAPAATLPDPAARPGSSREIADGKINFLKEVLRSQNTPTI